MFFGPLRLLLESESGCKTFLGPNNVDCQFLFWKCSSILCFLFVQIWGFFCIIGLLGAPLEVGVIFKNFFRIYLCRQSTFVLEVQPCLIVLNLSIFWSPFAVLWPFRAIFLPLGLFLRWRVRLKNIFGSYLFSQSTLVLKYSPMTLGLSKKNIYLIICTNQFFEHFLFFFFGQILEHLMQLLE